MSARTVALTIIAVSIPGTSSLALSPVPTDLSGTWRMIGYEAQTLRIIQDAEGVLIVHRTDFPARAQWSGEKFEIDLAWESVRGRSEFRQRYFIDDQQQLIRERLDTDIASGRAAGSADRFIRISR